MTAPLRNEDGRPPLLTNLRLTERLVDALEIADFDNLPVLEWGEV